MTAATEHRGRAAALLVALGLHALLFIHWPQQPALRHAGTPEAAVRPTAIVWLLPRNAATAPSAAAPSPQAALTRQAKSSAAAKPPPHLAAPAVGQAITLPPDAASSPTVPASAPRQNGTALDLRLPGRTLHATPAAPAADALADPRANSPRPRWEARMSRTLDTRVSEQVQADGSVRFMRGDDCVVARLSRNAQLDPFSAHATTAPRSIGSCH